MSDERSLRYETVVATLIGLLALLVSAYTAYLQRQQVRAQVFPVLEFDSGNEPEVNVSLANKGVGPALIKHVVMTVDGAPKRDWGEVMDALVGTGKHHYAMDTISGRVLSAGERLQVFTPHLEKGKDDPLYAKLNKERFRVGAEICFCSTLGDCWTLRAPLNALPSTAETRRCPATSDGSFRQ